MENYNRKLSSLEKTFYLMNKDQPFIIIMCAHLEGLLDIKFLEQALEIMKNRHGYYLSYYINKSSNGLEWGYDDKAKIPIEIIEESKKEQWIDICNYEMNISVPLNKAPLMKVIYLKKLDGIDIIFKFSHIISDGISVYNFIRETLIVIDKLYNKNKIEFPYSLEEKFPDVDFFPEHLTNSNNIENHLHLSNDIIKKNHQYKMQDRLTHIIPFHVEAEKTKVIIEASKNKGFSVNSILAAALVVNMKNYIINKLSPDDDFTIKSSAGMNIRDRYLLDLKNEQLGSWAGFGYVFLKNTEINSFWECAKTFQNRLKEFIDQNQTFLHLKNFVKVYSENSINNIGTVNSLPYVLLTNVGKLDMNEWYCESIKLLKLSFMTPMHRHWSNDLGFGICATTFNGRLNIVFTYMNPARNLEQAKEFSNQIIHTIYSSCK
ncbi:MAG: hypothetical protein H7A23_09450 [Leptospiraceae bacterium]|nr:hypothetical protein [Leptospiraceae bacterium]MCP5494768.1 hypothetical protein [Leptospiraceae bacterium]